MQPLADELACARRVAREAGAILRAAAGRAQLPDEKQTAVDLVTEFDRRAEAHIVAALHARFPEDEIVGEEGGGHPGRSGRRWLIDPIDGTTNFAHGLPFFCVSIGLEGGLEGEGRPLVGAIDAPALGWHFYGARGAGAFLVQEERGLAPRRLAVSTTTELGQSLLATGFPYDTATSPRNNLAAWSTLYGQTRGLRRVGAAALDLCFVAAGWMDGYWELKIKPWDVAAGALFVEEAGGRVTAFGGRPFSTGGGEIVATNGALHDTLVEALAQVEP